VGGPAENAGFKTSAQKTGTEQRKGVKEWDINHVGASSVGRIKKSTETRTGSNQEEREKAIEKKKTALKSTSAVGGEGPGGKEQGRKSVSISQTCPSRRNARARSSPSGGKGLTVGGKGGKEGKKGGTPARSFLCGQTKNPLKKDRKEKKKSAKSHVGSKTRIKEHAKHLGRGSENGRGKRRYRLRASCTRSRLGKVKSYFRSRKPSGRE